MHVIFQYLLVTNASDAVFRRIPSVLGLVLVVGLGVGLLLTQFPMWSEWNYTSG